MQRLVGAILGVLSLLFAGCAATPTDVTPALGSYLGDSSLGVSAGCAPAGVNLNLAGLGDAEGCARGGS